MPRNLTPRTPKPVPVGSGRGKLPTLPGSKERIPRPGSTGNAKTNRAVESFQAKRPKTRSGK